jgi:hypothetical protein
MTTTLPFLDVDINDISKEVSIFKHIMLCLVFNMTTTLPFLDVDINDISKEVSIFKHIMLCRNGRVVVILKTRHNIMCLKMLTSLLISLMSTSRNMI